MAQYREQGIVLRTYKLGETDRILHVLGANRGKVRAVAKGVRRPGSRFGGRLEPFSLVDLHLHVGRSLDIVTHADLLRPFTRVREDWVAAASAAVMVEAADRVAQEAERATSLFLLLRDGLQVLEAGQPAATVLDAWLLRLAGVEGYAPDLDRCTRCGTTDGLVSFHIGDGGLRCQRCADPLAKRLDAADITLLRALRDAGWDDLPAGEDAAVGRLGRLIGAFVTYHLERPLAALDLVPR